MGLFSGLCEACHNPILAAFNTNGINDWMSECVAVTREDQVIHGQYDGYGALEDAQGNTVAGERDPQTYEMISEPVCSYTEHNDGPSVWHYACWRIAGQPEDYRGQSANAPDQGHFFDEGTYDIPEPKTAEDVAAATEFTKAWREEMEA